MLEGPSAKEVATYKDLEIQCIVVNSKEEGLCGGLELINTNKGKEDSGADTGTNDKQPPGKTLDSRDAPLNICAVATHLNLPAYRCSYKL